MPASVGVESANGSERLTCVPRGYEPIMAKYELNERAVAHARDLIAKRQYVVKSTWGDVQPSADDENAFLETHPWDEYAVVAPRAHRGGDRRDEGPVRVRVWRPPACPSVGVDRVSVPRRGVGSQGDRARRPRTPPGSGHHAGVVALALPATKRRRGSRT